MNAVSLFDSACLLIVTVSAILHLNAMQGGSWWDRVSFALVAGGALGRLLEWWWPRLTFESLSHLALHSGCAMVGISIVIGRLQSRHAGMPKEARDDFIERRFGQGT